MQSFQVVLATLLVGSLLGCAGTLTKRQAAADEYRDKIEEVTDRLLPVRNKAKRVCRESIGVAQTAGNEAALRKIIDLCTGIEDAFDGVAGAQRVAVTAIDAYEIGVNSAAAVDASLEVIDEWTKELKAVVDGLDGDG